LADSSPAGESAGFSVSPAFAAASSSLVDAVSVACSPSSAGVGTVVATLSRVDNGRAGSLNADCGGLACALAVGADGAGLAFAADVAGAVEGAGGDSRVPTGKFVDTTFDAAGDGALRFAVATAVVTDLGGASDSRVHQSQASARPAITTSTGMRGERIGVARSNASGRR
jgi:hypothetical protein